MKPTNTPLILAFSFCAAITALSVSLTDIKIIPEIDIPIGPGIICIIFCIVTLPLCLGVAAGIRIGENNMENDIKNLEKSNKESQDRISKLIDDQLTLKEQIKELKGEDFNRG